MKLFLKILVVLCLIYSCKKKTKSSNSDSPKLYTFNSLKADRDTIQKGNVTNIKADFSGSGICSWGASAGDIFGSGNIILFGASSCCSGNHTITCTLTDSNKNTESKAIVIKVN